MASLRFYLFSHFFFTQCWGLSPSVPLHKWNMWNLCGILLTKKHIDNFQITAISPTKVRIFYFVGDNSLTFIAFFLNAPSIQLVQMHTGFRAVSVFFDEFINSLHSCLSQVILKFHINPGTSHKKKSLSSSSKHLINPFHRFQYQ